ncbi:efflux RND transporter periplasmic adaptor subunit [Balneolales bacterium ANBcel1]|nr:efflux RND transporter periplasmic adaptor subunit [Balneolales bacterium ANBcel1]
MTEISILSNSKFPNTMNVFRSLLPLFLLVLVLAACDQDNNANNNERSGREVVVEILKTEPITFEERVRVTGTVEALEDAIISAEVSGRVREIADRGHVVREGAQIVRLDDRMVRASLEMARANYELAQDAFERQQPLLQDSIISTLTFNQARAQRDQARSQLEQAEKQLSDSRIEAPFSGRIEERMVSAGELVNAGVPVVRLVNTAKVRINAGVPERYVNDIVEGAPALVHLRSYGGKELMSEIRYVGSVITPESRTFPVELVMDNREELLKPEMVVNLAITRKVWEDAVVVPRTALIRDEEGVQVFVIERDGDRVTAKARRVTPGVASGSLVVIDEGLDHHEEVVVIGQTNVSDGDRVRIQNTRTYERYH